jgi:membrane fusion protein (multidrug efflux system)
MSNAAYVSDITPKIGLRPSRQTIKRIGLALALSLGVAGAADFFL